MNKKRYVQALAGAMSLLLLGGCGTVTSVDPSENAAVKALESASVVTFGGDLSEAYQYGKIFAGDQDCARLTEEGLLDTKWNIMIDGDLWFYAKIVTDQPINEDFDDVVTGSTYGYYDASETCLGYTQLRCMTLPDGERNFCLTFLTPEGEYKDYYAAEDGSWAADWDNNVIAHGTAERIFLGDSCEVKIEMEEGCDVQMDFMDKLGMYMWLFKDLRDESKMLYS